MKYLYAILFLAGALYPLGSFLFIDKRSPAWGKFATGISIFIIGFVLLRDITKLITPYPDMVAFFIPFIAAYLLSVCMSIIRLIFMDDFASSREYNNAFFLAWLFGLAVPFTLWGVHVSH